MKSNSQLKKRSKENGNKSIKNMKFSNNKHKKKYILGLVLVKVETSIILFTENMIKESFFSIMEKHMKEME